MSTTTTTTTTTVTSGSTSSVYTAKAGFPLPQLNQLNWHVPIQNLIGALDKHAAIGPFCATPADPGTSAALPSTSLSVSVAGGIFLNASGNQTTYSGGTFALSASSTTMLWLDDSGVLYSGSTYPTGTQFLPLATVTTGTSTVTAISDDRIFWRTFGGSASGYIGKAGDTLGDGSNFALGTTTGTRIGTATTQKLAFFAATPIVQPGSTTDLRTALINLGLLASGGATPLNLNGGTLTGSVVHPVTPISSSTAVSTLGLYTISAAGNITITLPDATANAGGMIIFKRTDSTSNTVTISRAGSDLIDGSSTNTSLSSQWSVLRLMAASGVWMVI
ncbi:hypothetical protein UFOVP124_52 [uncultured Caudovirales phage]|uniref:Uncharacterized protein n=1 Tax=uncultured Caudovirales phage TaxID=2100421 RepID=A0A6J5LC53_9CAUD|nr:hypothetical protein UFOVP124_52 [uncultured Caudovirales phage]